MYFIIIIINKQALESQTREFNNLNKTLKTVINHRVTTLNSINEENNSNKRIFSYEKHQIVPIYHGTGVGIPKALETIRVYIFIIYLYRDIQNLQFLLQ